MAAMNYEEFQRHISKAGLELNEFAELMDIRPSSIISYRKKGWILRHLVVSAVLLDEMGERRINFSSMLSRVDLTLGCITPERLELAGVRPCNSEKEKPDARLRL